MYIVNKFVQEFVVILFILIVSLIVSCYLYIKYKSMKETLIRYEKDIDCDYIIVYVTYFVDIKSFDVSKHYGITYEECRTIALKRKEEMESDFRHVSYKIIDLNSLK